MDLELVETGNGGDLIKKAKDLSVISGFENFPYLAMFGGNLRASTPTQRLENEQAFDFWGNKLFFDNAPEVQFNSQTERIINNVPLTSAGRVQIENAVKEDMAFAQSFATVKVVANILDTDKLLIAIRLIQLDNLQKKDFIYIWDATRLELFLKDNPTQSKPVPPDVKKFFDDSFDDTFE